MRLKPNRLLTSTPARALLYRLVRTYSLTFRLKVDNEKPWTDHLAAGGSVLLCAWHQQFFSAIRHFRNYSHFNPSLMISRSRDGEIVVDVARRTGWHPVRGSSSRGGKSALKDMIVRLRATRLAGHIVDGPRGPAGRVKPGAIRLAQAADAVIVPLFVSAEDAWHFNSWDRFFIPKPFSRVSLRFGDMIRLPAIQDENEFEHQRRSLERIMRPGLIFRESP